MKTRILIIILIIGFLKAEAQTSAFKSIDSLVHIGRYQKALFYLKKIPASFESNKRIGIIYTSIDNHKTASKYYEKALLFKENYTTKVALGKSYQKEKKLGKAISVFEEITTVDSANLWTQYQLGKLYLQAKKPLKAKNIFKKLIEKDSNNAMYHYQMGVVYTMLKKRNLKMNSFLKTYKNDNEHIKSIYQLVTCYTLLRDKDSANIFIEKGLEVNPNHIKLNKLKINNLYQNKKYLLAINLLKKIDSLASNEHYTQKMLGRSFYKLKEYDIAEKYFEKALKIDKSDFTSHTYLGDINFDQKKYKKAEFNYMCATFIGKESRDTEYYQLARVYDELGKPQKAINAYKNSLKENWRNYRALFQIANVSENFYKDKKIAYKYYKNYIKKFELKDSLLTSQAKVRLKKIKKDYFLKGKLLE